MSQLIASASENLQIWEFINQEECKSISSCAFAGIPTSLSWNHTNQVVAVGLSDKKIDLVQATTGQLLSTLPFTAQEGFVDLVRAVKFSGNSRYLASAEGRVVQLWDLKKRSLKTKLEGHKSTITAISFFADGTLAAGDSSGSIRIWDIKSDSSYQEMNVDQVAADRTAAGGHYGLTCMELSLSGPSRIAAGYSDGSLCLWDPATLGQLRKQSVHRLDISAIAFSPKNPRLIATSSFDGRMTLVDTGSKSADASASIDIGGKLTSITFHDDAIHCAVGTDSGRVLFYDWRNVRKPVVAIECQTSHPIHALAFQVPKPRTDSAASTPARKPATAAATESQSQSPGASVKPAALSSPSTTPTKATPPEQANPVRANSQQNVAVNTATNGTTANASTATVAAATATVAVVPPVPPASVKAPATAAASAGIGSANASGVSSAASGTVRGAIPSSQTISATSTATSTTSAATASASSLQRGAKEKEGPSLLAVENPARRGSLYPTASALPLDRDSSRDQGRESGKESFIVPAREIGKDLVRESSKDQGRESGKEREFNSSFSTSGEGKWKPAAARPVTVIAAVGDRSRDRNASPIPEPTSTWKTPLVPPYSTQSARSTSQSPVPPLNFNCDETEATRISQTSMQNPNVFVNPHTRPVTSLELTEALDLVKYDFHREMQRLMKEQVRQFSIAQGETSKLFSDLNAQLQELLESNAALRAENDQLRRIY